MSGATLGAGPRTPRARVGADESAWRQARQRDARRWLEHHPMPSPRDEVWRDTPMREVLAAVDAGLAAPRPTGDRRPSPSSDLGAPVAELAGPRMVFVNGALAPALSSLALVPGVDLRSLAAIDRAPALLETMDGIARPSGMLAVGWAEAHDGALIQISRAPEPRPPVHIIHLVVPEAGPAITHPVTEIRIDDGAEVEVVEAYAGSGPSTVVNASTIIRVGEGASIDYHRVQTEAAPAIHLGEVHITMGRQARGRIHAFTLGAAVARTSIDVALVGDGGIVDLDGLALPAPGQSHNTVVTIDHAASHCTSTQRVRGVIADGGRASFTGRIVVEPGTVGTVADQSNRNLLLGPTAQADSQPWLEILADDVVCSHGATVGRLDDEALFYLRSRGIPLDQARDILIDAFIGDLLDPVEPEALRARLSALVSAARDRLEPVA